MRSELESDIMSSIFTYGTDPPRVSSPWLTPSDSPKPLTPQPDIFVPSNAPKHLADYGVTRLEAEPQEGPTEYKLHLLLRPRRAYSSSSTGKAVAGSKYQEQQPVNKSISKEFVPSSAQFKQAKQTRFESLTTQLLWRLQQSSPYHASSTSELVLPKLHAALPNADATSKPGKLLVGLEQSRGALYEIGVSDDGTLVGLTKDEMDESLNNLKVMAASLGCIVKVIRMVIVGDCVWYEAQRPSAGRPSSSGEQGPVLVEPNRHQEQLWVAEVCQNSNRFSQYRGSPR